MSTVLRRVFSVTRLSLLTGILLSAGVGCLAYVVTARSIESDAQKRFVKDAHFSQNAIGVRLKSYIDLLREAASMLQSVDDDKHRRFHIYVEGLQLSKNFPAVDNFNYAAYVVEADRPKMERELAQGLGFPAGSEHKFHIAPGGVRRDYLPVAYIEPGIHRPDQYGLDLLKNPFLYDQLVQARDDGKSHGTARPISILSSRNDIHLGIRMPVYRQAIGLDTVAQRHAAYMGSLGIAFSLPKLIYGVLDDTAMKDVRLTLRDLGPVLPIDGDNGGGPIVLLDSLGTRQLPAPPLPHDDDSFVVMLPFDFSGRPWQIVYSVPKSMRYTGFDLWYPKLMTMFGFLGSILLYALFHTLTSSRRAALQLAREMTKELRDSQDKLQLSHQRLRRLADHAYQVKELERKRIAREIHDDLGQNLLALRMEAQALAMRSGARQGSLYKRTHATLKQIDIIIKSVRQIISDLRPTVLDLGLSAAVEWQAKQFQQRTGIVCEVHDEYHALALPDPCATAFFRILQESLTNIVRHAHATRVVIDLRLDCGWLSLTVRDNGCGLQPGERNKFGSFGLVGIEERIVILGGTCTVFSEPGSGTTVMVSAPVLERTNLARHSLLEQDAGSPIV